MSRRHFTDLRQRVAEEAARIISEQGIADFKLAKHKAAERCGLREVRNLPGNDEIESALRHRQRLFGGARHRSHLRYLRETACAAMRRLEAFQPRLVGPVLTGCATEHSDIQLHLFTDLDESLQFFLEGHGLECELSQKRFRVRGEEYRYQPVYRFSADGATFEAAVFALDGLRQAPCSPVDGQPMQRAALHEVEELLTEEEPALFG
ncbi:MAG: hypothetical protein ACRESW_07420 [Nevskiales bacterium]